MERGEGWGVTDGRRQIDTEKQAFGALTVFLHQFQIGLGATSDLGNYPLPACLPNRASSAVLSFSLALFPFFWLL